jgi:hypothetical protein
MPSTEIMDMLPISDVAFTLNWQQEMSQQGGGTPRVADIGEELWLAEIGCSVLTANEARDCEAAIDDLRGAIGTFYLHNPRFPFPRSDPGGQILGASAVTIFALGVDNKSLRLGGLPVGYVISRGDFFHFDTGGTHRCLHRFTTGGVADGAGRTPLLGVTPHIRVGASTGLSVTLKRPAAEVFILPGTFKARSTKPTLGNLFFSAMQVP